MLSFSLQYLVAVHLIFVTPNCTYLFEVTFQPFLLHGKNSSSSFSLQLKPLRPGNILANYYLHPSLITSLVYCSPNVALQKHCTATTCMFHSIIHTQSFQSFIQSFKNMHHQKNRVTALTLRQKLYSEERILPSLNDSAASFPAILLIK